MEVNSNDNVCCSLLQCVGQRVAACCNVSDTKQSLLYQRNQKLNFKCVCMCVGLREYAFLVMRMPQRIRPKKGSLVGMPEIYWSLLGSQPLILHLPHPLQDHPSSMQREFSFTLDASVAVAFARNALGATVYKVTWQPGSKLILLAGLVPRGGSMEVEVRVMSPRFNTADMLSRQVVVHYPDPASHLPRNPLPDLVDTYEIVTMTAHTQ